MPPPSPARRPKTETGFQQQPAPARPARRRYDDDEPSWVLRLVVAAVLVGALVVGLVVVLPRVVKGRCVQAAADRGVDLTIDGVSLGVGHVTLTKVGMKLVGVPQIAATADDVDVTLSGLSPKDATVHGLAVNIDGKAEDVVGAVDAWTVKYPPPATATTAPLVATDAGAPDAAPPSPGDTPSAAEPIDAGKGDWRNGEQVYGFDDDDAGDASLLSKAPEALAALDAGAPDAGPPPPSSTMIGYAGAHVIWTRAFGDSAKIDATDVEGSADATQGSLSLASEKVMLTAGRATFGPWRATFDRDAEGSRAHVELDPVIHGGPSITYVRDVANVAYLRVAIARSTLTRLGLPPKSLGLAGDTDVEAKIELKETARGGARLASSVHLGQATFAGVPVDAKLDLVALGDTTRGLDVKRGSLVVGPIHAGVTGTVKLFNDGARADLAWRGAPIPCERLVKSIREQVAAAALGNTGLTAQIDQLAGQFQKMVGLKLTGEAVVSGLVVLDSRDVAAASMTMTANETCGVGLF